MGKLTFPLVVSLLFLYLADEQKTKQTNKKLTYTALLSARKGQWERMDKDILVKKLLI